MTLQYGTYQNAYDRRPAVVVWFIVYAVFMALLYLAFGVMGIVFVVNADKIRDPEFEPEVMGVVFCVIGFLLAAVFGMAPFLPRVRWVWIYNLVLICLGLTSACFWLTNIPLLIFWLKPETKRWFGAEVMPPGPGYYPPPGYSSYYRAPPPPYSQG